MPERSGSLSGVASPAGCGRTLLRKGGWANADVWRCRAADGEEWIEKDFAGTPWIVRNTLGRFLVAREAWVLRHLESTGVVPGGVRKLSPMRLREDVVPGFALRDSTCGVYRGNEFDPGKIHGAPAEMLGQDIPPPFFDALEAGIRACHAAGFAHLDVHNARNIMVAPGFRPVIIDWQAAVPIRFLPRPVRRLLENIDLAGAFKFRAKFRPGDLSAGQRRLLERHSFLRRHFWLPRIQLAKRHD